MYKSTTDPLTTSSKILIILTITLCVIGFAMQYSAGGGNITPYAESYLMKTVLSFIILFIVCKINLRSLYILTDSFYVISLILIILVDILGVTQLGAKRWLNLGIVVIQPSELMRMAIVLMLAKYFHKFSASQIGKLRFYITPILLVVIPLFFILVQPDLGTAILIMATAAAMFFITGFGAKYYVYIIGMLLIILPISWFFLHSYQKNRVLTFFDAERDPLGAGYHIIQSKIAIGSGGVLGKGYLSGTQGQLDFLPEKQTDFVFTLLAEEFGFIGALFVIIIYGSIIMIGIIMSYMCPYNYGKYTIAGFTTTIFLYAFVNIGMVSGILPVVGIPLPLISFGGTSMLTTMISLGIMINIDNDKNYI